MFHCFVIFATVTESWEFDVGHSEGLHHELIRLLQESKMDVEGELSLLRSEAEMLFL